MRRRFSSGASVLGIAAVVLTLISCSTPQTRISDRPDLDQSLSPRDQALVGQGQIRYGMSRNAVWLAWGSPDSKVIGNMRGHSTETWVYVYYVTYPYYYPYYGPYGPGFGFFGDPFYDPFYYSLIPPSIPYPNKTVTFSNSRVMSFQYLAPN
jgi:hypothetical protein